MAVQMSYEDRKKLTRTVEKLLECKCTSNFYTVTFSPLVLPLLSGYGESGQKGTWSLKCRESMDVTKVHWDVRLSEHC